MADEGKNSGSEAMDASGGAAPALVRYVALYRLPGAASRGIGRVEFDLPDGISVREAWLAARQRIKDSGWINPPPVVALKKYLDGLEIHVAGLNMV